MRPEARRHPHTASSSLLLGLAVAWAPACAADEGAGGDGVDCRAFETESDCAAAEAFTLDDGRAGRCRWFMGTSYDGDAPACSEQGSVGLCLAVGPTQPSCTFSPLDGAYPSCQGQAAGSATPPVWVEDGDAIVLLPEVCGPTVADPMSGRCGAAAGSEPSVCECPCL